MCFALDSMNSIKNNPSSSARLNQYVFFRHICIADSGRVIVKTHWKFFKTVS